MNFIVVLQKKFQVNLPTIRTQDDFEVTQV